VIDVDLSSYFDTIRHAQLFSLIAKLVQDPQVIRLVKQIVKATGMMGVSQGGPFSPLAANIYLNEVDWVFYGIRRKTTQGPYEAANYHRFADDIVITVSGHRSKRGWPERAMERIKEELAPLGIKLNPEKTRISDTFKGVYFDFLSFEFRRVRSLGGRWSLQYVSLLKMRTALIRKFKDLFRRFQSNLSSRWSN